ncbi:MAG: YfiR family protein [Acidimicrobiia bacterium]|nr:YfiR family protein [Acidimicrobiia bacterium]
MRSVIGSLEALKAHCRRALFAGGILAGLLTADTVRTATDEQVRAAFLYQLAQYVAWPPAKSGDPLRFCVLGNDDLAELLRGMLKGKSLYNRPLTVRAVNGSDQLTACDVAFLAAGKRKQLQELLGNWSYPPVLLVGETDGFTKMGGMVNLKIDEGRVSIEINLNTARGAGLDMRSQLLRLATIVSDGQGKP